MAEPNIKDLINALIIGNDMLHIPSKQMRKLLKDMVGSEGTGSGGSSGGGVSEYIQGVLVAGSEPKWEQTDEEKALNAELFKKIIDAYDNREPVTLFLKSNFISQIDLLQSVYINSNENRTILNIVFILALDYSYIGIRLSKSGDVSVTTIPMIPS